MTTTERDLQQFTQFVHSHLSSGNADSTLDELFDLWRLENPPLAERAANVAAIAAAIADLRRGELGAPAGENSRQLRRDFGIADQ
ncbi:MAG: hypothetical protein K1X71_17545 [Pirellulales bacterium]|nr:hypothetical protein [Pirellulales bacterium]